MIKQFPRLIACASLLIIACWLPAFQFNSNTKPMPEELLIGRWIITAEKVSPAYKGKTDLLLNLPDCEKDDFIEFKANGTYHVYSNRTICQAGGNEVWIYGTWRLSNDRKQILFTTSGGKAFSWKVNQLTATRQRVTYSFSENGIKYIIIQTAEKVLF